MFASQSLDCDLANCPPTRYKSASILNSNAAVWLRSSPLCSHRLVEPAPSARAQSGFEDINFTERHFLSPGFTQIKNLSLEMLIINSFIHSLLVDWSYQWMNDTLISDDFFFSWEPKLRVQGEPFLQ